MGSEEIGLLRTWAVEKRFWKRREEATVQIVGRPNIEIQQIKVEEMESRERGALSNWRLFVLDSVFLADKNKNGD